MREQNEVLNTTKEKMLYSITKKGKVQMLVISECIFKPQKMNIADRMFFSNFLDFSQFTVDSSESNIENRW